jgi:hypothetical protein
MLIELSFYLGIIDDSYFMVIRNQEKLNGYKNTIKKLDLLSRVNY